MWDGRIVRVPEPEVAKCPAPWIVHALVFGHVRQLVRKSEDVFTTLSLDRVVGKQMTLKFWFLKNHLDSASNGNTPLIP